MPAASRLLWFDILNSTVRIRCSNPNRSARLVSRVQPVIRRCRSSRRAPFDSHPAGDSTGSILTAGIWAGSGGASMSHRLPSHFSRVLMTPENSLSASNTDQMAASAVSSGLERSKWPAIVGHRLVPEVPSHPLLPPQSPTPYPRADQIDGVVHLAIIVRVEFRQQSIRRLFGLLLGIGGQHVILVARLSKLGTRNQMDDIPSLTVLHLLADHQSVRRQVIANFFPLRSVVYDQPVEPVAGLLPLRAEPGLPVGTIQQLVNPRDVCLQLVVAAKVGRHDMLRRPCESLPRPIPHYALPRAAP